jgi:23S rRNA pseudouridine2605 synthase
MHPSSNVKKTYEVTIDGNISNDILNKLSNGVELEDGKTAKATATQVSRNIIHLTIKEGKNRQVRRMIDAINLRLRKLKRIKYSNLDLGSLAPGEWRDLNVREVQALKKMVQ